MLETQRYEFCCSNNSTKKKKNTSTRNFFVADQKKIIAQGIADIPTSLQYLNHSHQRIVF